MILFSDRDEALNAPGDVRVHYKGGIYRKLFTALDCDLSVNGQVVRKAVYEHLHPHPHDFYLRGNEEFEGDASTDRRRFRPVAEEITRAACQTCRFWDRDEQGNTSSGLCREALPTRTEKGNAQWPRTRSRDWCGKHLRGLIRGT